MGEIKESANVYQGCDTAKLAGRFILISKLLLTEPLTIVNVQ
jgi:hypothetical protein